MNSFCLLVLCAQALLIQNVYGQCSCGQSLNQGLVGYGNINQVVSSGYGCGNNIGSYNGGFGGNNGGFGGNGVGQLGIVGELPIGGSTLVEGNLPIIGIVEFNGALPAGGFVTVAGSTPCQCANYANYGNYGNCGC